jgi:hypothetical protein
VFVLTPKELRRMWDTKARPGLFMGYQESSKAYRVFDIEPRKVMISRDVNFDETVPGGSHFDSPTVGDIIHRLDEVDNEGGLHLANFKYGGKRKSGAAQPTDPNSGINSAVDEAADVEATRRSTRQRVAPVEWWRASANMVAVTDLCELKSFKEAVTGPDQVGMVSRFVESPQDVHWTAVKRILRYLQGTKSHGVRFDPSGDLNFMCYSDADWAGDVSDCKSNSGFAFKLASGPISWGSKKQSSVSLSTSEAEYVALSLAMQEGKWIHRMLCELLVAANISLPKLVILEDNQSCIKMTKNPVNHGRAKHIDIKFHHIRDEVKSGEVEVEGVLPNFVNVGCFAHEGPIRTSPPRPDPRTWSSRL